MDLFIFVNGKMRNAKLRIYFVTIYKPIEP